jgi:Uma2 family endonuclease
VGARLWLSPDLVVIPETLQKQMLATSGRFEVYEAPMPLVVEVWSPSTGDYDVEEKLLEYQRRSDLEIWRIHPYERTLTAWRRLDATGYQQAVYRSGAVALAHLAGVTVDLDRLFE